MRGKVHRNKNNLPLRARFSGSRPLPLPCIPGRSRPPQAPEHVGQGMTQALLYMGDTIQDGVTGFFMKPARGAKEHGVSGFIKGVGKGVAGLIAAPVSGEEQYGVETELRGAAGDDGMVSFACSHYLRWRSVLVGTAEHRSFFFGLHVLLLSRQGDAIVKVVFLVLYSTLW